MTADDLGIREIETEAALAEAGLTHVTFESGESVPWEAGLHLLDVESGAVEGWIRPEGDAVEEVDGERRAVGTVTVDIRLSPGNRFLLLPGHALHDRLTGRTYTRGQGWLASTAGELIGWGTGSDERLIFRSANVFVVVDGEMQPVAQFAVPDGGGAYLWPHHEGRYVFVHDLEQLYLFDLRQAGSVTVTPSATWSLSGVEWWGKGTPRAWVEPFDGGVAVIQLDSDTCRIARYSADGSAPTDHTFPCWPSFVGNKVENPFVGISPDGSLIAIITSGFAGEYLASSLRAMVISIFDAGTGEELFRIKGAQQPWRREGLSNSWLADSSGIVVNTPSGHRLVTVEGQWQAGPPGRSAPHDPTRYSEFLTVVNQQGEELASLSFGESRRPILGLRVPSIGWGGDSNTIRVRTGIFYKPPDDTLGPSLSALAPVIERPPFEEGLLVEVTAEPCADLYERGDGGGAIVACLPAGSLAEVVDYGIWEPEWMRLRTDDGVEGWAHSDSLRWASDGVRLEE